ncbi:hypothetical protein HY480_03655 [Candidatus Uhrbacteria bacterium]|nr:hypothetical protein [Candidatus Uhrbacteria bacterium]
MPERARRQIEEQPQVPPPERGFDAFAEKRALFERLRVERPNLSHTDQHAMVARVLDHAVEDGFVLAKEFGITPTELARMLIRPEFLNRHGEDPRTKGGMDVEPLVQRIVGFVVDVLKAARSALPVDPASARERLGIIHSERSKRRSTHTQKTSPLEEQLSGAVDAYYTTLLQQRQFAPGELSQRTIEEAKESDGEHVAREHLERLYHALKGDYLAPMIRKMLEQKFLTSRLVPLSPEELQKELVADFRKRYPKYDTAEAIVAGVQKGKIGIHEFPELQERFMQSVADESARDGLLGDFLTELELKQILERWHVPPDDVNVQKTLEKARYRVLDLIAESGAHTSKRLLTEDLKEYLYALGMDPEQYEFGWNAVTKQFEGLRHATAERVEDLPASSDIWSGEPTREEISIKLAASAFGFGSGTVIKNVQLVGGRPVVLLTNGMRDAALEWGGDSKWRPLSVGGQVHDVAGKLVRIEQVASDEGLGMEMEVEDLRIPAQAKYWYGKIEQVTAVGDAIVAAVQETGSVHWRLWRDGELIPNGFSGISSIAHVGDELIATVKTKMGGYWLWTEHGDRYMNKNQQKNYDRMGLAADIGGKASACAVRDGRYILVIDGEEVAEFPTAPIELADVGGKPAAILRAPNGNHALWWDGEFQQDLGTGESIFHFALVDHLTDIGGKPAVVLGGRRLWWDGEVRYIAAGTIREGTFQVSPNREKGVVEIHDLIRSDRLDRLQVTHRTLPMGKVTPWEQETGVITVDTPWLNGHQRHALRLLDVIAAFDHNLPKDELLGRYGKACAELGWNLETEEGEFQNHALVDSINRTLPQDPVLARALLRTMPAVADPTDPKTIERLTLQLFPELHALRAQYQHARGFLGRLRDAVPQWMSRAEGSAGPRAESYLAPSLSESIEDGDPRDPDPQEVIRFRETPPRMVATHVFGKYDRALRQWQTVELPLRTEIEEPATEYTATLPSVQGLRTVQLPRIVGAEIIPERVHGVASKGQRTVETPLSVSADAAGQPVAEISATNTEEVVYTQRASDVPPALSDVLDRQYDRFREQLVARTGAALTESLGRIPQEFDVFLQSIRTQPPQERVAAIEEYVRSIGHYDMDNREVQAEKRDQSFEERLRVMRSRMDDLRARHPERAAEFAGKEFAGVCVDFNLLATALLRRAGFPSGMLMGFRPKGASVTTRDAHAAAFVVWPGHNGEAMLVPVDGTPNTRSESELAALGELQLPSLRERSARHESADRREARQADGRLADMLAIARGTDAEAVRQLSNGELEHVVNAILRAEVRERHVDTLRAVCNAARYAPENLRTMDVNNPASRVALLTWVRSAVEGERRKAATSDREDATPAGTALIALLQEFEGHFTKDLKLTDRAQALLVLQDLVDVSRDELSAAEHRMATAVITYLRAKRMVKE